VQIKERLPARLEQDPEAEEVSLLTGQAYGDAAAVNVDKQDPLGLGLRKVQLPAFIPYLHAFYQEIQSCELLIFFELPPSSSSLFRLMRRHGKSGGAYL